MPRSNEHHGHPGQMATYTSVQRWQETGDQLLGSPETGLVFRNAWETNRAPPVRAATAPCIPNAWVHGRVSHRRCGSVCVFSDVHACALKTKKRDTERAARQTGGFSGRRSAAYHKGLLRFHHLQVGQFRAFQSMLVRSERWDTVGGVEDRETRQWQGRHESRHPVQSQACARCVMCA